MSDDQQDLFEFSRRAQSGGESTDRRGEVVDSAVAEHLVEAGLSRGRIGLAEQLVSLENGLSVEQRRALLMAVVVGLEAQARGSTFVPLPSKGEYFRSRLEALIPEAIANKEAWRPERLGDLVDELLRRRDLDLVGEARQFRPLVVDRDRLYHQRMFFHEQRLVQALARRLEQPQKKWDEEDLQGGLDDIRRRQPVAGDGSSIVLNAEQEYALLTALHMPMTLITGGPGTGKTSIVVSILRMLVRLGVSPTSIALAAPTGKAANRMAESIYGQLDGLDAAEADQELVEALESPRTLHRLLGYSPRRDRFRHHGDNPLPHRLVVVDEASMVDLFLMERLLGALSSEALFVLLGDADQLPSVDTGAVLRDLVPDVVSTDGNWRDLVSGELALVSATAPTASAAVRLETSYRMRADDPAGSQILSLARSVRDFEKGDSLQVRRVDDLTDIGDGVALWEPDGGDGLGPFVDWWFEEIVVGAAKDDWKQRFNAAIRVERDGGLSGEDEQRAQRILDHYGKARILTVTRVYATGSEVLNEAFHRRMEGLGTGRVGRQYRFHPGEPVMMLRNDYERNLFNGDQGVVLWGRIGGEETGDPVVPVAVFPRAEGLVAYRLAELREDLEKAFAMTVHKAQGSEFDRVCLVLPSRPMPLLNRELLYTGLTRARRAVLLVGSESLVEYGAGRRSERFSAVAEKLAELTASSPH